MHGLQRLGSVTVRTAAVTLSVVVLALLTVSTNPTSAQTPPNPTDAKQKELERFDTEFAKFLGGLADDHAAFAARYKTAGAVEDAISQCRWALKLEAENAKAMKELGFVRKGDEWVEGKLLIVPKLPDFSAMTEAEVKAWNARQEAIEKACGPIDAAVGSAATKAAKAILNWARRAEKLEAIAIRRRALGLAGWYGRESGDVVKARGLVERDGGKVAPVVAELIDAARKALADAPRGNELAVADEQISALGWNGVVRVGLPDRPFTARTTTGQVRAHRLFRVGCAIQVRFDALLGESGPMELSRAAILMTEVTGESQYSEFISAFGPKDNAEQELALRLVGYGFTNPRGYVAYSKSGTAEEADDHHGNSVAASTVATVRGKWAMPWIARGIGYMMTAHSLGTTMTPFYQVVPPEAAPKGRTAVRTRKVGGNKSIDIGKTLSGPALMRRHCVDMVAVGGDISFVDLAKTHANDMTDRHIAKSMSLMEWLAARHGRVLGQWLTRANPTDETDLSALIELLGLTEMGLQTAWEAWVLEAY